MKLKGKSILKYTISSVILVLLVLPIHFLSADHLPGDDSSDPPLSFGGPLNNNEDQPCRGFDVEDRDVDIDPGDVGSGAGEVPVYDNDLNANMVSLIEALSRSAEFTEFQDGDVQRTAEYLRLLCEKEYEQDHTLQHAYADLIGLFVEETQDFIFQGYNGNPAFLTSQEAYYLLVDIAVRRVFMQDIADSARLGVDTKRVIIENVAADLFPNMFPTNDIGLPVGFVPDIAADNVPGELSASFYDDVQIGSEVVTGGYAAFNRLLADVDTDPQLIVEKAMAELDERINKQISYEQEKLDWGRGFFSYEVCDLGVFVRNQGEGGPDEVVNREDRRNCRIATPGSLIQDQTSLVFGTALRQMEINDEYEEWIAPNTLAVLSDILSYRGFNNLESRNPLFGANPERVTETNAVPVVSGAVDPTNVDGLDDINLESRQNVNQNPFDPGDNGPTFWANQEGPLPFEFSRQIDFELFEAESVDQLGEAFFNDILDPDAFLP